MRLMSLFAAVLLCCPALLIAQSATDRVADPHIASVHLAPSTDWYAFPVLMLGDTGTLTLSFDELAAQEAPQSNFTVTFIPCDMHWQPARVLPVECYTGFVQASLRDYRPSEMTTIPYRHYAFRFPEEGQEMKRSGNYLMQVFRDGDEDQVVAQRRFVVLDRQVSPVLASPFMNQSRLSLRNIELTLNAMQLGMADLQPYLHVLLLRNYRWNDATELTPTFTLGQNHWRYSLDLQELFEGGGHMFRQVNTSMTHLALQHVAVWVPGDTLTALLKPDFPFPVRQQKLPMIDLNGGWLPLNENLLGLDSDINSNYVNVRFRVESSRVAEPVHVVGRYCGWEASERNQLHYDEAARMYTGQVLLKQGIYDYALQSGPEGALRPLEGNAREGENEYMALVYYLPPGERCHRLVGIWVINHL